MPKRNSSVSKMSILATAEAEFAQNGLAGARIDEIAEKASINKRMLYEYFGNKEGLYVAVLRDVLNRFAVQEAAALDQDLSCVERLKHMIRFYFEYLRDNPTYVNLLLWENLNEGRYIREIEYSRNRAPSFQRLAGIIESGKASGVFRREIDAGDVLVSLITVPFCFFSNRHTLSKLFGYDVIGEEAFRKRIDDAIEFFLAFLCVRYDGLGGNGHVD